MVADHARLMVKVYVLSDGLAVGRLDECSALLARAAAGSVPGVELNPDAVAVLFVKNAVSSPGDSVMVEVDLPMELVTGAGVEDRLAAGVGEVVKNAFPDARVQCKVYPFDSVRGAWRG